MQNTEKVKLRWNNFESNIGTAFRELRYEKDLFDVTLACDDNQVEAHKVILSACSPFFRTVLRRNPHQHPLFYLRGVKFTELVKVLDFMYLGEVDVAQEELNNFLSVAEDLRVEGLTKGKKQNDEKILKSEPRPIPKDPNEDNHSHLKRRRPSSSPIPSPIPKFSRTRDDNDDISSQKIVPVKHNMTVSDPRSVKEMAQNDNYQFGDGNHTEQRYEESEKLDASMGDAVEGNKGKIQVEDSETCSTDTDSLLNLSEIGRIIRNPANIGTCIKSDPIKKKFNCDMCLKFFETKNYVDQHIRKVHKPLQPCPYCGKQLKTGLNTHIRMLHAA